MNFRDSWTNHRARGRQVLLRYGLILISMVLMVALLALLEILLLSRTGQLELLESVRHVSVLGVSFSSDGHSAVSRVQLTWTGRSGVPFERKLLMHQLASPDVLVPWSISDMCPTDRLGAVALSPNGNWLAIVRQPDSILISPSPLSPRPHHGKEKLFATTSGHSIGMVAWSPDGEGILAVAGKTLFSWEFSSGQLMKQLTFGQVLLPFLSLSQNGASALIGTQDQVMMVDLESGSWNGAFEVPATVASGSLSSDGQFFVVTTRERRVWLAVQSDGHVRWKRETKHISSGWVTMSPDDESIATVERRYDSRLSGTEVVVLLDAGSGEVRASFVPGIGSLMGIQFCPDGHLSVWSAQGKIAMWNIREMPREVSVIDCQRVIRQQVSSASTLDDVFRGRGLPFQRK